MEEKAFLSFLTDRSDDVPMSGSGAGNRESAVSASPCTAPAITLIVSGFAQRVGPSDLDLLLRRVFEAQLHEPFELGLRFERRESMAAAVPFRPSPVDSPNDIRAPRGPSSE